MAATHKLLDGDTHSKAICQMTKSIQYAALLVCFQCLVVWEMLSHAQTKFPTTTVSALAGTKAQGRANCPLLMGSEGGLT